MKQSYCAHCTTTIATMVSSGFIHEFSLSQLGILRHAESKAKYHIEQLKITLERSCNDCMHAIYAVVTDNGLHGTFTDSWEIVPL